MKRYIYISTLFAAALTIGLSSCEEKILREVDTRVALNPDNTYLAGDEVLFDFKGVPDYIFFYSGEVGSEYRYRYRTTIEREDLETCKLIVTYMAQYGAADALDVYVSKTFGGLLGTDADADLATMEAIQASMDEDENIPGWDKLPYEEGASGAVTTQEYDITDYADGFTLAFHWNPATHTVTQRTYRVNIAVKTKFRDRPEITTTGRDLGMISISMNTDDDPERITDAYYNSKPENGTVRFDTDYEIFMSGAAADKYNYAIDSWVLTNTRPLNNVVPDRGLSVKGGADEVESYSYIYPEAGTYKATFVLSNGNYQGLERKVQDITVTITEPIALPE